MRTPSPISMEVPSIVAKANNSRCLANLLFSNLDLSHSALCVRRFGNSESQPSACWFGIKLTLAFRHKREYMANVPPEIDFRYVIKVSTYAIIFFVKKKNLFWQLKSYKYKKEGYYYYYFLWNKKWVIFSMENIK